jgi:uncharacterized protein (DUF1330 family)
MGAIAGGVTHDLVAIIRFLDMDHLEAAFASDAYQAIVPLGIQAADETIVKFEQSV